MFVIYTCLCIWAALAKIEKYLLILWDRDGEETTWVLIDIYLAESEKTCIVVSIAFLTYITGDELDSTI